MRLSAVRVVGDREADEIDLRGPTPVAAGTREPPPSVADDDSALASASRERGPGATTV